MRMIDAENVNWGTCPVSGYAMKEWLAEQPTIDAVEVVRCKDCKRWQRHTEVNRDYGPCRRYGSTMRFDDFCSYGERKDGEG